MEEFPIIILFIILSAVSSLMKSKKKQEEQAKNKGMKQGMANPPKRAVSAQPKAAPAMKPLSEADWAPMPAKPAAPVTPREGIDVYRENALPRQPKPVMQTPERPAPRAPVMNGEGRDACHEYMLHGPAQTETEDLNEKGMDSQAARELVRGIIFSEIMDRPQRRYARRPQ